MFTIISAKSIQEPGNGSVGSRQGYKVIKAFVLAQRTVAVARLQIFQSISIHAVGICWLNKHCTSSVCELLLVTSYNYAQYPL